MSEPKITMKLLVDKSKNKVLFAEAGKECVDFLFHMLSLPLGSIVGFLTKSSMANGIGGLYGSLEDLNTDYFQDGFNKDTLLNPKSAVGSSSNVPLLTLNPTASPDLDPRTKTFYACPSIYAAGTTAHRHVSDVGGQNCPSCSKIMSTILTYVVPATVQTKGPSSIGYVKGVITYMIMDDLCVQPMSMVSSIALLNKLNVEDVASLEEREVTLDISMGLALLKASLMSKTVLTDVFVLKSLDID